VVGVAVGFTLGSAEGRTLGIADGVCDGIAVGMSEGVRVGVAVVVVMCSHALSELDVRHRSKLPLITHVDE